MRYTERKSERKTKILLKGFFFMKYKAPKTTCSCGNPRRPNAQNCYECHRRAQRKYRAEMREASAASNVYANAVREFKRMFLLKAVKAERGNLCRACIRLGVCRSTMTRAMREAGLTAQQVKTYLRGAA
jgi:DNA-binding NtrC family response regulator